MAIVEEINVAEDERDEDYVTEESDEDEGYDDEDDDDIYNETIFERIAALVDVVPPLSRYRIEKLVGATVRTVQTGFRWAGKGAWILATGGFLIALPVALEYERESFALQQENQQRLQQAQTQMVQGAAAAAAS
ncbi:mitochondrial outer membrane translocase complex, subunit Tom22 [Zopfochytrium polystomum]|nr:mitochondrial outer membrane translocase complex, subunit Tom22 [Zopfochytrium polystomum]